MEREGREGKGEGEENEEKGKGREGKGGERKVGEGCFMAFCGEGG